MPATVRDIIDQARLRHWSFHDSQLHDGAALLFLQQRQRDLLLEFRNQLRGLIETTVQLAAVVNGILVGVDGNGDPYYTDTFQDGWPLHLDINDVPYFDSSEPPVAGDPFGTNGGTPGWPLPADFASLLSVTAIYGSQAQTPVDVIEESTRLRTISGRNLRVFATGNRLVPVMPTGAGSVLGIWSGVVAVQMTYLAAPLLTTLDDEMTMPAVLINCLVADVAELMAGQSRQVSDRERDRFRSDRLEAEKRASDNGFLILGSQPNRVMLKR